MRIVFMVTGPANRMRFERRTYTRGAAASPVPVTFCYPSSVGGRGFGDTMTYSYARQVLGFRPRSVAAGASSPMVSWSISRCE